MPDKVIMVEILQGTQVGGGCSCCSSGCASAGSCGSTVDNEDLTRKLAEDLEKTYQDQVAVKYVDVDKEGLDKYPIMERVLRMGYSYPITLINGRPRYAGAIMVQEIKNSIEEIMKEGNPEN